MLANNLKVNLVERSVSNYSSRTFILGSQYLLISMMFYDVP